MTTPVTRRRFLGSAAGAASLSLLPSTLRKTLAAGGGAPDSDEDRLRSLRQVEHVMILMQENRSFDHYFGSLSGVRGFSDPHALTLSTGRSVFHQPDPANPDGYTLPFHLDTTTTSAAALHSTNHDWGPQHRSWNGGQMDNWLPTHRSTEGQYGPLTMGYYTRNDLPFHYALADAFTICDRYHCSAFGPTHPNRLYAISGTIDPAGTAGGPAIANSSPALFTWTTYPERLQDAGISWRYYVANPAGSDLVGFARYRQAPLDDPLVVNGLYPRPPSAIADDILNDRLPAVSWLNSQYLPSIGLPEASEHPPALPAAGAQYIYDVLEALGARPDVWAKTVLFITWDENDGLFDHVPPPTAPPGTPDEWVTAPLPAAAQGIAGPIGLGFRVPMLVVSPWSRGGWICSETFDHTSTLRFLERRFGVGEPNIGAWRRRAVGDLTSALRFRNRARSFPRLPDPAPLYQLEQQEVATLPPPSVPATQTVPRQEPGRRPHTR